MKLQIRIDDAPSVAGGKAIVLCDERGEPLPNQIASTTETEVGGYPSIQVTFAIDGETVRFA